MKINEETVLIGDKVVLVPYRKEHVDKYHGWMSSEEIRQQTASEPLSIAEEYEMQRSWQQDEDKLTFIVLAQPDGRRVKTLQEVLEDCQMAGDVNLFLSERHCDEGEDEHAQNEIDAELEVMIAEPQFRQRGLASEALSLLIHYASTKPTAVPADVTSSSSSKYLPVSSDAFLVKVGFDNKASINLFSRLGFVEVKRSEIWKEVEMRPVDGGQQLKSLPCPAAVLRWGLS